MQYDPAAYKAFKKAYLQYIKHVASIENGGEMPEKEVTSFSATDLEIDDRGMPRVPDPIVNINKMETNITQQQVIRALFTKHYGE